jgi:hypothetical protein
MLSRSPPECPAVILDLDLDAFRSVADGDEDTPAAIFRGVFHEVAEHLVQILALDAHGGILVAGKIDGDMLVEPVDGPFDRLKRGPDFRARLGAGAAADRAGAGEMVVDLAAHRRRLRHTVSARSGFCAVAALVMTVSGVFQRMGEIAGVAPRFLGLYLIVDEEGVQFLGERLDLSGKCSSIRDFSPERMAAIARRTRRSGQGPYSAWSAARMMRPRPRMAKERIRVFRSTLICSSSCARLSATLKRQRTGEPGRRASRSTTRIPRPEIRAVIGVDGEVAVTAAIFSRRSQREREGRSGRFLRLERPPPVPLIWK